MSWIINGLSSKLDYPDLVNKLTNYDVIFLYESWSNPDSVYDLNGYRCYNFYRSYKNTRARRSSGGVVVFIRESVLPGVQIVRSHFETIIWLKICKRFFKLYEDVYIAGVYVWGESSPMYREHNVDLFYVLQDDVYYFDSLGAVMLCGDYNARVRNGTRPDYIVFDTGCDFDSADYTVDTPLERRSMDSVCNGHGIKLIDLCKATGLRIANGRLYQDNNIGDFTYTNYAGSSVIDYLLLKQQHFSLLSDFMVHKFYEWSDHAPLSFNINCCVIENVLQRSTHFRYIKWRGTERESFRQSIIGNLPKFNDISNSLNDLSISNINNCVSDFTYLISCAAKPLFERKCVLKDVKQSEETRSKKAEWFDMECVHAKQEYLKALKLFNSQKSEEDRLSLHQFKSIYKKVVSKKKQQYKYNKIKEIENMRHKKPKDFWKLFSKRKTNANSSINIKDFYDYFSTLSEDLGNVQDGVSENFCNNYDFNETDNVDFEELDAPFSMNELYFVIRNLKRDKSYANDELLNEYFIESFDILSSHILDLFNAIFIAGVFPDSWKEGIIIPIHKKNDKNDVNNYRGITLVSCLSKVFTGILNKRLNDWAEKYKILTDCQFGFRKNYSTTDAIFVLNSIVQHSLNHGKKLYCAFIDLKKAFDSIYLNGLWLKLFNLGVKGKLLRIVHDMYSNIKLKIRSCNSYSEYFEVAIGLKQGEILSPLMFSIFINDLDIHLRGDNAYIHLRGDNAYTLTADEKNIILMLFADDMVIIGESPEKLQEKLNLLENYCNRWGLSVNTSKTKIMVFRKRGRLSLNLKWTYKGSQLDIVNEFNYLGTVFNHTGGFNRNADFLTGKGLKALNALIGNLKKYNLSPKTMCQLFDAFVGSILSYGCEVWGFSKSKSLERLHLKFCKLLLNVKQSTSTNGIYGELGRYPLYINRYCRVVKFWCKILSSENNVVNSVYKLLLNDSNRGLNNWVSELKTLLSKHGFLYVWNDPSRIDKSNFHIIFKQRLVDTFLQTWNAELNISRSLCTYKNIKIYHGLETYLEIMPKKYYVPLARLRLSSHHLRIETARYSNQFTERNNRVCTICNSRDLEDEFHFVLICPCYSDLRKKYIKKYFTSRPSVFKFVELMQNENPTIIRNLGKFVYEAFNVRKLLTP